MSFKNQKGGMKFDYDKLRYDLIPVEVEEEMAKVITYGAKKYDDNNWQLVGSDRYLSALRRHLAAWRKGEKNDSESGLNHLSHALVNVAFLLWKEMNQDNIVHMNIITENDLNAMEEEALRSSRDELSKL